MKSQARDVSRTKFENVIRLWRYWEDLVAQKDIPPQHPKPWINISFAKSGPPDVM